MKITIEQLTLLCKGGKERVPFSRRLSFFHGEMSTGKSTVVEMINYCFGGDLVRTPAVTSEVVGVQLILTAGETEILIERSVHSRTRVDVTWQRGEEKHLDSIPLASGDSPVVGDDIYNLSDFLLRCLGIPLLKVRKNKSSADSEMHRIGFRDFYKFVYLDQDDLDSSLFLLEVPIRQEKSKDVLRYVMGFHSERLSELEISLSDLRAGQRSAREAAKQIDEFLGRYGFNSQSQINDEIEELNRKANAIEADLKALTPNNVPSASISDEDRHRLDRINRAYGEKEMALRDVEEQLREQLSLSAELLSLKFKVARSAIASQVLEGAEFHLCPACGTGVAENKDPGQCNLCHSPLGAAAPSHAADIAVVERDLSDRIDDLERSTKRLERARDTHGKQLAALLEERAEVQRRVDAARASLESQYMQRVRVRESELGAINERRRFLARVVAMPSDIEARRRQADRMSEDIAAVEREISREQQRFSEGRNNVSVLATNFINILRAIHFPGISDNDTVQINIKTWMPYILPDGKQERAWTFADAGSGGKKVLFKICFALALHVTVAQQKLSLPKLLIIDSTMKNITPDINPDIVEHFYKELYRLLSKELREWQCILVDQTYFAPPAEAKLEPHHRLMKKDDPEHPPLISYYHGH